MSHVAKPSHPICEIGVSEPRVHHRSVLDLHQRAAFLPTEPPLTWLHFVRARFVGEMGRANTAALTIQAAAQTGETVAELRGIIEFSSNGALPVVYECSGSLDLATRELALEDSHASAYEGRFAENGRVISLTRRAAGGTRSKPFHLIESGTLAELL